MVSTSASRRIESEFLYIRDYKLFASKQGQSSSYLCQISQASNPTNKSYPREYPANAPIQKQESFEILSQSQKSQGHIAQDSLPR
jgi:hypothetical protein